jgi:hypothetical protein
MLERAQTIQGHLNDNLTDFTGFSAKFNQAYADDLQQKIDDAYDAESGDTLVDQQVTKTISVEQAMGAARQIYRRARAYALLTFKNNEGEFKEITSGYGKARSNQAEMIVFLEKLHQAVSRHSAALEDPNKGGMPTSFPTDVENARQALVDKNQEQEGFIDSKETSTQDRVDLLNEVYNKMTDVNNIAQVIYFDDPAKRSMFVYRSDSGREDSDEYTGDIAADSIETVTTFIYQPNQVISFENEGVVPLLFDLAKADEPNTNDLFKGNLIDLGGGALLTETAEWLNDTLSAGDEAKIVVKNPNTDQSSSYRVRLNLE